MKHLSLSFLSLGFLLSSFVLSAQEEVPNPLLEEAQSLREQLDELTETYRNLEAVLEGLSGEDRKVLMIESEALILSSLDLVYGLSGNLLAQKEAGLNTEALQLYVTELMGKVPQVLSGRLSVTMMTSVLYREKRNPLR